MKAVRGRKTPNCAIWCSSSPGTTCARDGGSRSVPRYPAHPGGWSATVYGSAELGRDTKLIGSSRRLTYAAAPIVVPGRTDPV